MQQSLTYKVKDQHNHIVLHGLIEITTRGMPKEACHDTWLTNS